MVKPKECYSCAVCYFLCPKDAITMKKAAIEETRAGVALSRNRPRLEATDRRGS